MAANDKTTIFASPQFHNESYTERNDMYNNAEYNADDPFHSQSKLARTHLKLSDLCIQDDLIYQSISDTGLSVVRHEQLSPRKPPSKPPRHIPSNGMQTNKSLERTDIPQCYKDLNKHCNLLNDESMQLWVHCSNSGRKWLKRPASDKEDRLTSSVQQSKQTSSGTLQWASPTHDGPSEGSIQASSQLLQEHVVFLDLEASSNEESDVSVVTTNIWPHRTENLALQSSFASDKGQELDQDIVIPKKGHKPADVSMPYLVADAIQRLSPIFDEPSCVESFNDSSPEQVVPTANNALKLSNSEHKNMYDTGSSDHNSLQDFCTSNVYSSDRTLNPSSPVVPDISVCNTDERVPRLNLAEVIQAEVHANTCNEPHYEIYSLCSGMDIELDEMSDSNQICIDEDSMSLNTSVEQKVPAVSKLTTNQEEVRPSETSCLPSDIGHKSPSSDLLNPCESAVLGCASPVHSNHSTTNSDSSSACGHIPLIELMPEELIFKILFYLSPSELCLCVAPISRKWRDFAYDPILWQFLDLSHFHNLSSICLSNLLRRAKLLKSLNLRGWREVTEMNLDGCSMLQEINLGFCENLNEDALQTLSYHCKALTIVNVEGSETVDNAAALHFTFLPELRVLNMSHCTKITDDGVVHIAVLCEKLEALNIDGIPWISDYAIQCLASERSATLEAVFLDGAELTDDSIKHLTTCPKLHTLSISFCEEFSDRSLSYLRKLNSPKHLRLKSGVDFTEPALADLFLADCLASLTYLNLTECSELCDRGVKHLTTMCRSLKHLALCWCWDISDVGVESIVDNCGQLEVLDLLGLNKIRGKCLERIPEALPYLNFLDLRQCNMIQDAMLITLLTVKKDLSILNYYGEEVKCCTCEEDKTEESMSCQSKANPLIQH